MKREIRSTIAAALMIAPMAISVGDAQNLVLQPESRLWVSGTSTVRSYECTAETVEANVVATDAAAAAAAVLRGEKAVTAVSVTIPAAQLNCANGTMNEHMLKALKAEENPEIRFLLASYELTPSADGTRALLQGTLDLGGASKQISVEATVTDAGNGGLRVVGSHEVLMSEYGLRAPRLMLGTLRVHDKVLVNFDLHLEG